MGTLGQKLDYLSDTKSILKQKINNLGGSLTDESTFRSYGDYLDELYNEMPKVTGEGTEITLTPTRKGRMQLDLEGNTSQATRILPEGYTQLDYIESTGTQYIDTGIYLNQDSSVEIEGNQITTQVNSLFGINPLFTITSHTLSSTVSEFRLRYNNITRDIGGNVSTKSKISLKKNNGYLNNELVYTFNEGTFSSDYTAIIFGRRKNDDGGIEENKSSRIYYCKIWDNNTLVRDFVPCKNQNNEVGLYDFVSQTFFGNAGTGDFVAGNEVSIPNPDYPQPIHVVTGNNSVGVQGKNLWDGLTEIGGGYSSTTGEKTTNNTDMRNVNPIKVEPNTQYIFSNDGNGIAWNVFEYSDTSFIKFSTVTSGNSFITSNNTTYINISKAKETYAKLQLEEGSTITSYVQYYHADYPIDLGSLELCKIGDYQDYLYKENGNWYKHKAINKGNFNDIYRDRIVKVTSYIKPGLVAYAISVLPVKKIGVNKFEVFCDIFSQKYLGSTTDTTNTNSVRNSEGIASHTGNVDQLIISIDETRLSGTSVEDFFNYITNLNPQIAYILNTPITTQITDETLISQLDAIENAMSTTGTTTITQTNAYLPFIISASALTTIASASNE